MWSQVDGVVMRTLERSASSTRSLLPGLKQLDRWVLWAREETEQGTRKRPVQVSGPDDRPSFIRYRDIDNWYPYTDAVEIAETHEDVAGVGVVITASRDDFVVVDIDGCRDPTTGRVDETVWQYVRSAETYTEISQSGTGLHLVFRGQVPNQGWTAEDDVIDGEVYDKYFIATTEDHVAGTPRRAQQNAQWLAEAYDELDIEWRENLFGESW